MNPDIFECLHVINVTESSGQRNSVVLSLLTSTTEHEMPLKDLIRELFDECGKFEFNELQFGDQSKLAEAYILENEDIIYDLFSNVNQTSMALHLSQLYYSVTRCAVFTLAEDIRLAMVNSDDLQSLIDGEIDHLWTAYEVEHEQCSREASHDDTREAVVPPPIPGLENVAHARRQAE